jgi:hypothetical protein
LENVYRDIKTNPFYQGENCDENKKMLDTIYELRKYNFLHPSPSNNKRFSINDPPKKNGLGNREYLLIALTVVGIIFVVLIIYLLMSENQTPTKSKKKR